MNCTPRFSTKPWEIVQPLTRLRYWGVSTILVATYCAQQEIYPNQMERSTVEAYAKISVAYAASRGK